jgi:hypothetical protein
LYQEKSGNPGAKAETSFSEPLKLSYSVSRKTKEFFFLQKRNLFSEPLKSEMASAATDDAAASKSASMSKLSLDDAHKLPEAATASLSDTSAAVEPVGCEFRVTRLGEIFSPIGQLFTVGSFF